MLEEIVSKKKSTPPSVRPSNPSTWQGYSPLQVVHIIRSLTQSVTLRATLESPVSLTCLFLDCGRKPEELEKTQPGTGRTRKLRTQRTPPAPQQKNVIATNLEVHFSD